MMCHVHRTFSAALLLAAAAFGQNFDNSNVAAVHGDYFVREILISGQNADGTITSAKSLIGVATFDGKGSFTFTGQSAASASAGTAANLTATGSYQVAANGFIKLTSLADNTDTCFGGISALGPAAFVASATEGTGVDILIAIPAGANVSNATFKGAYTAGFIDFLNGQAGNLRQGFFNATADGAGKLGAVAVSGTVVTPTSTGSSQTENDTVTYSLAGEGAGTINFGAANTTSLISSTKTFYISSDGSIVIGGTPGGFDLIVGVRALTGPASAATSSGVYFTAGLEDFVSPATASAAISHAIDGFYGSTNATGSGTSLTHNRFQSFSQSVFDWTYDSQYTVGSNGVFTPPDTTYQFTLGANGQAFIATGTGSGTQGNLYSMYIGLAAPKFTGTGVFLNPLGVVNAANFAPATNPIAPNEVITLYGTNIAPASANATSLPLPTSLAGVQVMINGQAAPLYYVTSGQIAAQVPSNVGPDSNVFYATVQVNNNGFMSNPVTLFTSNSAPGVFTASGNGIGPAAAQHGDYTLITSASPAKIGETVVLYAGGLGSVSPAVATGAPAGSSPTSANTRPIFVDFGGAQGTVVFAGLTPGLAGLYQLNTTIGSGTGTGTLFVNVSTDDAYTSQATLSISGGAAGTASVNLPASVIRVARPRPHLQSSTAKRPTGRDML